MNLRHYRIFLTVCETGKMTSAADVLFMTQPSVSQAIAELEKEYGVHLFERLNHRLYLTKAGEQLRTYAGNILNLCEQSKKELAGMAEPGSIRIGASLTIGMHVMPNLLKAYKAERPDVEIFSQVDNTSVIEKMLMEDKLDLGLVEGPVLAPQIREETLYDDELVIVCGQGHPFWQAGKIKIADLDGQAFIVREHGSGTRNIFERVMSEAGAKWRIAGVYNNTEAIKQAVCGGLGMAFISKISVLEEIKQGVIAIVAVQGLPLMRNFNLIYHRQKYFTSSILAFIEVCKQYSPYYKTSIWLP
jgi:LysR family transcriptional regulator, transcriptional activator of the cysJI operon